MLHDSLRLHSLASHAQWASGIGTSRHPPKGARTSRNILCEFLFHYFYYAELFFEESRPTGPGPSVEHCLGGLLLLSVCQT